MIKYLPPSIIIFMFILLNIFDANAQCGASIVASSTSVCQNSAVSFKLTGLSASPSNVDWDFGFKQVSSDPSPTVAFTSPGVFTVKATIKLSGGGTCVVTQKDYITVHANPVIGKITPNKPEACSVGESITFKNSASGVVKWDWTIEGKIYTTTTGSVTHKFSYTGYPLVQLIVTSKEGCTTKGIFDSLVNVAVEPSVSLGFEAKTLCDSPGVLSFKPIYNLRGQKIKSYEWFFQNATQTKDINQYPSTKTYLNSGRNYITLKLTTVRGCVYKYSWKDAVKVTPIKDYAIKVSDVAKQYCKKNQFIVSIPYLAKKDSVKWTFDSGLRHVKYYRPDSAMLIYKDAGLHKVVATIYSGGCSKQVVTYITSEKPDYEVDIIGPTCICDIPKEYEFKTTVKASNYNWELFKPYSASSFYTGKAIKPNINEEGDHLLMLKTIDSLGCVSYQMHEFNVKKLVLNNIFSGVICDSIPLARGFPLACWEDSVTYKWYVDGALVEERTPKDKSKPIKYFKQKGKHKIKLEVSYGSCYDEIEKYVEIVDCSKDSVIGSGFTFLPFDKSKCVGKINIPYIASSGYSFIPYLIHHENPNKRIKGSDNGMHFSFNVDSVGAYDIEVKIINNTTGKDTIYKEMNIAHVYGIKVDAKIDRIFDCFPSKKLDLEVTKLENYSKDSSLIIYNWELAPFSGGYFLNGNVPKTSLIVQKNIKMDIQLTVINDAGCKAVWQANNVLKNEIKADFEIINESCFDDTLEIINKSTGKIFEQRLSSDNQNDIIKKLAGDSFYVLPKTIGDGKLKLWVRDEQGCKDSITKVFSRVDLNAGFLIDDTTAKCTPAGYTFTAFGKNVDAFYWYFDFGDTVKTYENVYRQIFDLRRLPIGKNKFSVTMVAEHKSGCRQKIVRKDVIELKGPVINLSLENPKGCSPHTVTFKNFSTDYENLYIDYGDDTSLDSGLISKHTYYGDTNKFMTIYKPYVIADDGKGCKVNFFLDDSIMVFNKPKSNPYITPIEGCEPLRVSFADSTPFIDSRSWAIYQQDTVVQLSNKDNWFKKLNAGTYSVSLFVYLAENCTDSIYLKDYINVSKAPKPIIQFQDTLACVNTDFLLFGSAEDESEIVEWTWAIEQFFAVDSIKGKNAKWTFTDAGFVSLELFAKDKNGCVGSVDTTRAIVAIDKIPAPKPLIYQLGYEDNHNITGVFKSANPTYFTDYKLKSLNSELYVFSSSNMDDTLWRHSGQGLDSSQQCYQLLVQDICMDRHQSDVHCAVHLTVNQELSKITELKWKPYIGWDSVQYYNVYRISTDSMSKIKLATVAGDVHQYVDSSFCDSHYIYQVEAVKVQKTFKSASNSLLHKSEYTYQNEPLELYNATVLNNQNVLSYWQKGHQLGQMKYLIDKQYNSAKWQQGWKLVSDTFLVDDEVQVGNRNYSYKVRVVDKCNNQSELSNRGKTILLKASQSDQKVHLQWNSYQKWNNGVFTYKLQRRSKGELEFTDLEYISDSNWSDNEAYFVFQDSFYYRVMAIENGTKPDTSYSNVVAVVPLPSIYVANAFTPNGDGLNDVFDVSSWALKNGLKNTDDFQFNIYNRWGQHIFLSNDFNIGWDGTYNGKACPVDVYVWLITARALDGTLFYLDGNVQIMK